MTEPTRPATLNDVAKAAGVSPSGVSYALSGKGRMARETRERIIELAQRMNYRPNPIARSLVGAKTGLAALAFSRASALPHPSLEVDYFSKTVHGAMTEAVEQDYAVVLFPSTRQSETLRHLPVDGVVILDPVPDDPLLTELKHQDRPHVIVGKDPSDPDAEFVVDNDHIAATKRCLDHLRERGGKRIALFAADLDDSFTRECLTGYRQWCARRRSPRIAKLIPVSADALHERVASLLAASDRPDAIYANTEPLGLAVVRVCSQLGLSVPEDVMVIACSDRPNLAVDGTSVTALRIFPDEAGKEAIRLLIALISNEPPEHTRVLLPTRLDPADSTARTQLVVDQDM